jgi:hypothetical protein
MIMMFGSQAEMMETQSPEWIKEMIEFMGNFADEITQSGELVAAEGLVDGSQAKIVDYKNGAPVVTDGPYAESKESIIGFWIVDVIDEARALELTSKVVAFIKAPVEVRQVGERPPEV